MQILGLWVTLVSLYFLWEAVTYRNLTGHLAEWEFLHFNRYWPTLTFLLLTFLCSAPLILPLYLIRRRQRRDERLGPARTDDLPFMLDRLSRLQSFFSGVAIGGVTAVVVILVLILQLPSDRDTPRSIVIGSLDAIAPPDARAVLTGSVQIGETAQFNENLLLVKRSLYFAPIRSGPHDKSPLRYFVQVRRTDVDNVDDAYNPIHFPKRDRLVHVWRFRVPDIAFTPYLSGVLSRRALPGEVANAYHYAGYTVDRDNYVLFRSSATLAWRFEVLAAEFALVAIIASAIAWLFSWRRSRLKRIGKALAAGETLSAAPPRPAPRKPRRRRRSAHRA